MAKGARAYPVRSMKAKLTYTGIRVRDLDASIRFYTTVLGMTVRARGVLEPTGGTVADLASDPDGAVLELNYYPPGSEFDSAFVAGEGLDHLGFQVEDLDRAVAEASKAGHPVVHEVRSGPKRWVYIEDPNGIWIELFA